MLALPHLISIARANDQAAPQSIQEVGADIRRNRLAHQYFRCWPIATYCAAARTWSYGSKADVVTSHMMRLGL